MRNLAFLFTIFICANLYEWRLVKTKKNLEAKGNCWVCFTESEYKRLDQYWWARYYDEGPSREKSCLELESKP